MQPVVPSLGGLREGMIEAKPFAPPLERPRGTGFGGLILTAGQQRGAEIHEGVQRFGVLRSESTFLRSEQVPILLPGLLEPLLAVECDAHVATGDQDITVVRPQRPQLDVQNRAPDP